MRIGIADHNGKSFYLQAKLAERFDISENPLRKDYELLLVDSDSPHAAPAPFKHNLVKECITMGIPVVLYPHGGQVDLEYDGIRKFHAPISLQLLHGEGCAEVYRAAGLSHRFEAVGWMYGPVRPREIPEKIDTLLFAPIHPWGDGQSILRPHMALNHVAYKAFLAHPAKRKIVRSFGHDFPNGIHERVDGVEYQQSDLMIPWDLIQEADGVISYGTLAHCALALGKPTVFIYSLPSHTDDNGAGTPAHFSEYEEFVRYPASLENEGNLDELFKVDASEFVDRFIGGPLDVDKLTGLLEGLRPSRAIRRKLPIAA